MERNLLSAQPSAAPLKKLATIYELKSNLTDDKSKIEVVKLVYSLAASGNERITSLPDKLKEMNLPFDGNSEPETCYLDNPLVPSFLYIFGFLLGDGSFFIRIRQTSAGTLNFIPILSFPQSQKKSESNVHLYTMMSAFFGNLGCKSYMSETKSGVVSLKVEGIKAMLTLVPLFQNNVSFSYWKFNSIDLLSAAPLKIFQISRSWFTYIQKRNYAIVKPTLYIS